MPTVPSPSPTITRAVKLKRRPPLTTLATRLIVTTFSMYCDFSAPRPLSRPRPPPPPRRCCPLMRHSSRLRKLQWWSSELQSALAGAVGHSRHASRVLVAGAVEDDRSDSGGLGAVGHELADALGLGGLVTVVAAQVGFHRRRRGDRVPLQV